MALGWRPQFLITWDSHGAALVSHGMGAGFPQSSSSEEEEGKPCNVFYGQVLGATLCSLHNIALVAWVSYAQCGRGLHESTNTER